MINTKIYCISTDDISGHWDNLTDEEFITQALKHGDTFNLNTFANAFNQSDVNTNTDVIRIISTEIPEPMHTRLIEDIDRNIEQSEQFYQSGEELAFIIGYLKQALQHIKTNLMPSK